MKTTLIIVICLIVVFITYFFILGFISRSVEAPGLLAGKLSNCPNKPNCGSSERQGDAHHYITPINIPLLPAADILAHLKSVITEMGGTIQIENNHYLASTFHSTVFGFEDDFEIRIDTKNNVIHLRSASRVGRSDLGENKKRIDQFKRRYAAKTVKTD